MATLALEWLTSCPNFGTDLLLTGLTRMQRCSRECWFRLFSSVSIPAFCPHMGFCRSGDCS